MIAFSCGAKGWIAIDNGTGSYAVASVAGGTTAATIDVTWK
ncbi:hypothetical protein [Nonomuraea gerenzanensis]|uniref:Uncharacterized protein n=1 Tax=Nonomuraea gerenzanensis TaxID=93944 RepID=A0A1M4E8I4_9ACTN|nr:hypothetical protein [Nonomuraea gerenzanensis]SBO95179.1 hypothetical protein BN4615_P4695 [Nonomuraea gerenzanensis]